MSTEPSKFSPAFSSPACLREKENAALGWFAPKTEDRVPEGTEFVILIGNAGPAMFRRFARERDPSRDLMDDWCRSSCYGGVFMENVSNCANEN